jgi:2-keto-3-deoxy-L-rhamnonate aldolase RhmA
MTSADPTNTFDGRVLRQRTRAGTPLLGTFLKTASHQTVEILGQAKLDFLVIDAEHAPFDRSDLDVLTLAARAVSLPCLVRLPTLSDGLAGASLDLGATGILVPHVVSAVVAAASVRASRYDGGTRGFSPSTRAAQYGTQDAADHRRRSDESTSVWCQIEDAVALEVIDEIAAVANVDCLFVGRADLAVSFGVHGPTHPIIHEAVVAIGDAGRRHKVATGIHIADLAEIEKLQSLGFSVFVCGSDQSWLLSHARALRTQFDTRAGE